MIFLLLKMETYPPIGTAMQVALDVVAEIGDGQDGQRAAGLPPLADDVVEIGPDELQGLPLVPSGVVVPGVPAQRADDDRPDVLEDAVAAERRQEPVEVLDVDLDVLDEQDVPLPVELRRVLAVEEIDEGRQVPADGDARELPGRRGGQPGGALILDLLALDQGEDLPEIPLAQPERGEIDRRDAGMEVDLVEEKGEIREADEDGPSLAG